MKKFLLGLILGAVIVRFAEERKKKMLTEELVVAGDAIAEAAGTVVDVVKSAADGVVEAVVETAAS
jgi:hypothetical protein